MTRLKEIATEVIGVLQQRIANLDQTPVTRKTNILTVNDLYRVATSWTDEEQTLCRFVAKSIMLDLATILLTATHHLDFDNPIQGEDAAFAPPGTHSTVIADQPVRSGTMHDYRDDDPRSWHRNIRPATAEDEALLIDAQRRNVKELGFLSFKAVKEKLFANRVLVAQTTTNRVVGFLMHGAFDAVVSCVQVWVDPDFRRDGVALALLWALERRASEFGASKLRARVREDVEAGLRLYAKAGFQVASESGACGTRRCKLFVMEKLLKVGSTASVSRD